MEFLAALLVGRPLNILIVAALFMTAFIFLRRSPFGKGRRPRSLLVPAGFWAAYAVWEYLVLILTPEANIRVDLLVIWPVLLCVSLWFSIRALKRASHC